MCSCSHHSRTRVRRPTRGSPVASSARWLTAMLSLPLCLELALQRELDLVLAPRQRALGRHAVDRLGDDVGQDEVDDDELYRRIGLGGPALLVNVFGLLRQHGVLRVARPDRVLCETLERRLIERAAPDDEGV